jgi:hypothetical protein
MLKKMINWFKTKSRNSKGFSFVETTLYVSLASIIMATASQAMMSQVESYAQLTQTQTEVMDTHYSLTSMANELLRVDTADIIAISSSQLDFVDSNGATTKFTTGTYNGHTALFRGSDVLLPDIQTLTIKYYDSNGNQTNVIANIRQYEIAIKTAQTGKEGVINLTTKVTPRQFLYANYN